MLRRIVNYTLNILYGGVFREFGALNRNNSWRHLFSVLGTTQFFFIPNYLQSYRNNNVKKTNVLYESVGLEGGLSGGSPSSFCLLKGGRELSFWQLFREEDLFCRKGPGRECYLRNKSYFGNQVIYTLFFQILDFLAFLDLDLAVCLLYFFIDLCEFLEVYEQRIVESFILLKCLFSVVDITNTNLVFWIFYTVLTEESCYMVCLNNDENYDFILLEVLRDYLLDLSGLVFDIPKEFLLVTWERSVSNFNYYVTTRRDFTYFCSSFHPCFRDYENTSFEEVKLDFLSMQTVKYNRLVFLSPISNFKSGRSPYDTILNGISLTPYKLLNWGILDCWRLFLNLKFVPKLGALLYPVESESSPVICWELLGSISKIGMFEFNCFLKGFMVLGDSWTLENVRLIPVEHDLYENLGVNKDNLFITVSSGEGVPKFLGDYGVNRVHEVLGRATSFLDKDRYLGSNPIKIYNPSFFSKDKLSKFQSVSFPFYVKYVFSNFCSRTCWVTRDFRMFSESEAKKTLKNYYSIFSTRKKLLEDHRKLFELGSEELVMGSFKKTPEYLRYFSEGELSMGASSCFVNGEIYREEVSKLDIFLRRAEKSLCEDMRLGVLTCSGSYKESYCSCVGGSFKTSTMCVCEKEFILVGDKFIKSPNFFSRPSLPKPIFLNQKEASLFLNLGVGDPFLKIRKKDLLNSFIEKANQVIGSNLYKEVTFLGEGGNKGLEELLWVYGFFAPKVFFTSKFNSINIKINFMSIVLERDLELENCFDFDVGVYTDVFTIIVYPLDFFYFLGGRLLSLVEYVRGSQNKRVSTGEKIVRISKLGLEDVREKDALDFLVSKEYRGKNIDWLDVGVEYTSWMHKLPDSFLLEVFGGSLESEEEVFRFVSKRLLPYSRIPYFSEEFLDEFCGSLLEVREGGEPLVANYLENFCFLLSAMCLYQWLSCGRELKKYLDGYYLEELGWYSSFKTYFINGVITALECRKTPQERVLKSEILVGFLRGESLKKTYWGSLLWCLGLTIGYKELSEDYGRFFMEEIEEEGEEE